MSKKYFIHVDGDNFFASCELTRFPQYRGKPVVVGEERGIAVALSPEAKKLGVVRGMPIFQIHRDYPNVITMPSHFDLYEQFSRRMAHIIEQHSDRCERYSIDECFATIKLLPGECLSHIDQLRTTIESMLGITVSIGIASTKVLVKVGSKQNKPNGSCFIDEFNRDKILASTPIEKIWGLGPHTCEELHGLGITSALDFTRANPDVLTRRFSLPIIQTWHELRGTSRMSLGQSGDAKKSMQSTRMLSHPSNNESELWSELSYHTEILCRRMLRDRAATNHISFFLREKGLRSIGQDLHVPLYTQDPSELLATIETAFQQLRQPSTHYKSVGVCVWCTPLAHIHDDLFGNQSAKLSHQDLLSVETRLRSRFGDSTIYRASSTNAVTERKVSAIARNAKSQYIAGLPLPYIGEVV